MSETKQAFKRTVRGTVVSDKTDKTCVVKVQRKYKHPIYSKFVNKSKKYHVHDEKNIAKEGDVVTIIESRPYSKLKRWELIQVH